MFDIGRLGSGDIQFKPSESGAKPKKSIDNLPRNDASRPQSGLTEKDFDTIGLLVDEKLKSYLKEN